MYCTTRWNHWRLPIEDSFVCVWLCWGRAAEWPASVYSPSAMAGPKSALAEGKMNMTNKNATASKTDSYFALGITLFWCFCCCYGIHFYVEPNGRMNCLSLFIVSRGWTEVRLSRRWIDHGKLKRHSPNILFSGFSINGMLVVWFGPDGWIGCLTLFSVGHGWTEVRLSRRRIDRG